MCGVDHQRVRLVALVGEFQAHRRKDARLKPALPAAVERLVRAIGFRRVAPAQPIVIISDYPAEIPPVINPGFAVRLRKEGLKLRYLVRQGFDPPDQTLIRLARSANKDHSYYRSVFRAATYAQAVRSMHPDPSPMEQEMVDNQARLLKSNTFPRRYRAASLRDTENVPPPPEGPPLASMREQG